MHEYYKYQKIIDWENYYYNTFGKKTQYFRGFYAINLLLSNH